MSLAFYYGRGDFFEMNAVATPVIDVLLLVGSILLKNKQTVLNDLKAPEGTVYI